MGRRTRWLLALLTLVGWALSACAKTNSEEAVRPEPAKVVKVEGTNQTRVVLTAQASERIGVETATVREITGDGQAPRRVIDAAAVIYDTNGDTYVFTNPEPLVFERQRVTVDVIEDDLAVLSDGPPVGTAVATVGTPELYGIEAGIGGNE